MKYTLLGDNRPDVMQVFLNRGVSPSILRTTDESLHSPFLLKNMEEAIDLVKKHADNGNLIYIQQDPDADGMTSTTLMYTYLKEVYPDIKILIGIHKGKQHGIDLDEVEAFEEELGAKIDLVIAPDASSNEHSIHKILSDRGTDVLVLDHHEATEYSPYATMVNPQLDDYPNKNISGVGVVQKFARAFDMKYHDGDLTLSDKHYDLVAIGMIADMIEINTPEAVHMVQKGMSNLNNLFVKALYAKQDYSMRGQITPTGISFYIAPLLNAVTRTATQEEKLLVLKAMVADKEYEVPSTKRGAKEGDTEILQEQAVRIMVNIKSRQGRLVDKAIQFVDGKIEQENLADNKLIVVDIEEQFEKEFTGLIANKVMAQYQKPVLIGSVKNGILAGSGRSYDKSSLPDLKGFLNESGIVNFAEGHASAHGFGVDVDKLPTLLEYSNEKLADLDFTPQYLVDYEWDASEIKTEFLEELIRLQSFWAKGLEEPYFAIKNLRVPKGAVELGGDFDSRTFKITLPHFSLIKFRVPYEKVKPFVDNQSTTMNLIGRVSLNEFQGKKTIQVFMEDFEVVGAQKFYF